MNNIVQFPTPSGRAWSETEAPLRNLFDAAGVPESVQLRVLERTHKAFFVDLRPFSFQAIDPDQLAEPLRSVHLEMLKQIRSSYSDLFTDIVAEYVAAEIRFCRELGLMD